MQPTNYSGLESLADFLNFEFDSDDVDELERLKQKYRRMSHTFEGKVLAPARLWQWKYGTTVAREAERLQKKIRRMVLRQYRRCENDLVFLFPFLSVSIPKVSTRVPAEMSDV